MDYQFPLQSLPAAPLMDVETMYLNFRAALELVPIVFSRWLFTCLTFTFIIPTSRDAEICGTLTALFIWAYDPGLTNMIGSLEELQAIFGVAYAISPLAATSIALLIPLGFVGLGTVFGTMKRQWFGRFMLSGMSVAGAVLS